VLDMVNRPPPGTSNTWYCISAEKKQQ
jgi:hypothetical protein